MAAQPDEGVDIIKFFLGVMSLLTVFVALFAAFNWSKAKSLAEEVEVDELDLGAIEREASKTEFLELVSRSQLYEDVEKITSQEFGRYLEESAAKLDLDLQSFRSVGSAGQLTKKGYTKQSYQFTIERQNLDIIVSYLWYLQGSWPGLKIENLSLERMRARRGQEPQGWQATVTASIFRFNDKR